MQITIEDVGPKVRNDPGYWFGILADGNQVLTASRFFQLEPQDPLDIIDSTSEEHTFSQTSCRN